MVSRQENGPTDGGTSSSSDDDDDETKKSKERYHNIFEIMDFFALMEKAGKVSSRFLSTDRFYYRGRSCGYNRP